MNTNVSSTNSSGAGNTSSTSSLTRRERQNQRSDFDKVMEDKERKPPKGPQKDSSEAKGSGSRSVFDLPKEKKQSKGASKFEKKEGSGAQPTTPDKKSEVASKEENEESGQPVDSVSETTTTKGGAETSDKGKGGQKEPKTFVTTDTSTESGKGAAKKPDASDKGTSSKDISVGDEPIQTAEGQTPSSASKAKGEATPEGKTASDEETVTPSPMDARQPKKTPSAGTETTDKVTTKQEAQRQESAPATAKQETAPREGSPTKKQTEQPDLVKKVVSKEETTTKKEPGEPKKEMVGQTRDKLATERTPKSIEPRREEVGPSKKEKGKGDFRTGASDQEMAARVVVAPQPQSTDVQTSQIKSPEPPPAPSTIKEIASQIVEQMQVMRRDGHITTQITLRNPPILEGATITLVSPETAKKEVSISFANLSPEAKAYIDRALQESPLSQALEHKGIVVHALTTTTQAEPLIPSQAGQASQEQRGQQQGGGQGGQQQGREQPQEGEEEEG